MDDHQFINITKLDEKKKKNLVGRIEISNLIFHLIFVKFLKYISIVYNKT